jgi:hypothetical protein
MDHGSAATRSTSTSSPGGRLQPEARDVGVPALGGDVLHGPDRLLHHPALRERPEHFAEPGVVLNVPLTALNTFMLICSLVTMVKAFAAIENGTRKG